MVNRKPTEQLNPPAATVLPSGDGGDNRHAAGVEKTDTNGDALADPHGFESACPVCGRGLSRFANYCPQCDAHLPFGGTFSPGKTAVAKALSWILLVVFVGSMAVLFGLIIRQMIEAGRG